MHLHIVAALVCLSFVCLGMKTYTARPGPNQIVHFLFVIEVATEGPGVREAVAICKEFVFEHSYDSGRYISDR